jgi:hypothetical protein
LGSQTSSQDVSAFYLRQIYQLQASANNTDLPLAPGPPNPVSTPTMAHVFLFASLILSLSSAVFATLVQEWVRRYLLLTQPRLSPHRRARIRAFITQEGSLVVLQRMVHFLHTFLHLSILLFAFGLIAMTSSGDSLIIVVVTVYIAIPLILYLRYSLMPYFEPHSIFSTPLSGFFLSLRGLPRIGHSLFRAFTCRSGFRQAFQNLGTTTVDRSWLNLDYSIQEVEKLADDRPTMLDTGTMSWLLNSLGEDQEMEQFLAGIPGFYRSKRVEDPAQVLRALNTHKLPRAIVSFMDRSLSSELVPDIVGQRRIRGSLKAMDADSYLLQRTFYHALCSVDSAVFQCVDFVHLADRCTSAEDADVRFLAKCVVAVAISRVEDYGSPSTDDRWSGIVQRGLKWSQPSFAEYRGQRDSVKLQNLVQIARELGSAHPDYDDPSARTIFHNTLNAACQLHVESASERIRNEFCELWNHLLCSMQDLRRDPVVRSNAMRVLSLTRAIYIPLHEDTDSRCFAYSTLDDDLSVNSTHRKSTAFPLCTVSAHHPSLGAAPEYSEVVASGEWKT